MKVLDLRCADHHRFEGWFASEADFLSQCERKLVTCPVCSGAEIVRLPSAPRLSRQPANRPPTPPPPAESEDVGDRFAGEARRIHHGESPARSIRGQASGDEVASLRDEGIEVVQVAIPDALKGPVH